MASDRIILRLNSVVLGTDVTHEHTDWEVAEDEGFTNIKFQSLNDTENKLLKVFIGELEDKKYYARARMLLSTGYTTWTEVKDFEVTSGVEPPIGTILPVTIGMPTISTDSDRENHALENFTITVTNPPIIGDGVTYTSTTYVIEDINGKVIFAQPNDTVNRDRLTVDSVKLEPLSIYRIMAYKVTSSNDLTPIATMTIKTTIV